MAEEDRKKEESRRGQILKEKLYPFLAAQDKSIEEIKIFLQVIEMAVNQGFIRLRPKTKVMDLKLEEELRSNPKAKDYQEAIALLHEETVDVADDILKSMVQIIENNVRDENKLRKFKDLPLKFFNET